MSVLRVKEEQVIALATSIPLPDGWGWLMRPGADGEPELVGEAAENGGLYLYIAMPLPGGRIVRGGVLFLDTDTEEVVLERAQEVVSGMRTVASRDAASWN